MSKFNVSTNHPIIPNAQEYMYEKQFVSIHSEDRHILKYPSSSDFEIELPQDYCNVQAVRLARWSFPSTNYSTFTISQNNIYISFQITKPFNPGDYNLENNLLNKIYDALQAKLENNYIAVITEGFYNHNQMAVELTNRFNNAVSIYIAEYLTINEPDLLVMFNANRYNQFVVAYDSVGQKLWFGNKSSDFIITNNSILYTVSPEIIQCAKFQYPEFSNWGLPSYLGFTRCVANTSINLLNEVNGLPRFFYGDYIVGDGGFWLVPDTDYYNPGSTPASVYYLVAPLKINLIGNSYFYIEIDGMNNIDETMPFAVSNFTSHTNETNGIVKSSFAKIGITTSPIAQWNDYGYGCENAKIYNPPAERIRKLKFRLRYHNGLLVNFNNVDYSIMLEFTMFRPQKNTQFKIFNPYPTKIC